MTRRRVLTDSQVSELMSDYLTIRSYEKVAQKYRIGASTVRDIVKFWTGYSARLASG